MNRTSIEGVKELLIAPKNIVIVPHKNPDGDAIGASLALYHYLKHQQHCVHVIVPNDFPDFLKWMPGQENIIQFDIRAEKGIQAITAAEIIFTLDFNTLSRTGNMEVSLHAAKATFIMIDHHQDPDTYATYTYSDTRMSSTCEMIYNFIAFLNDTSKINAPIATCIYTGIMTDTGSFRFPSTTSTTHRIVSDLIDKGARNGAIHHAVYDAYSLNRLQLLGCALKNMVVIEELHTVYISLSEEELNRYHHKKGDTEGIVNYGLSIEGIRFAAIFIQHPRENHVRISFRSTGDFPVNKIAKQHFNGGGHLNAAGGRSDLPLEETIAAFKTIITEYKDQLN